MANVTIVLNDAEQQAFQSLLDAALRQGGIAALDVVYHFRQVFQGAALAAAKVVAPAVAAGPGQPVSAQSQAHAASLPAASAPQHTGILGQIAEAFTGHSQTPPAQGAVSGSTQAAAASSPAKVASPAQPQPSPATGSPAQSAATAALATSTTPAAVTPAATGTAAS
jgi:hypothetical protein